LKSFFTLRGKRRSVFSALLAAGVLLPALTPALAQGGDHQDYPTVAIADYVFGCMGANGQTRQALEKCSCSIDVIASLLPYDKFIEAETVARMRLLGGEKGSLFRAGVEPKEAMARLRRAQAEAEIRCF
jgi:hypothetical protein